MPSQTESDGLYWFLGVVFAAACGYVHVRLHDSGLAVLMVTGFAMFLAYKRPESVWRWALLVGLGMPAAALFAQLTREHPSRGMVVGSFAGMAFSIVSAVGGKILRRARNELFPKKVDGGQWTVDGKNR